MSTFVASALFFLLVAPAPVQNLISQDVPDGLTIVKASWQKLSFRPGWDEPQDPASNVSLQDVKSNTSRDANGNPTGSTPLPSTGVPAVRPSERLEQRKNTRSTAADDAYGDATAPGQRVQQYLYQVKLLNNGKRTIEAVDWEYAFSSDDTEASRHRFQTFRRIKPANASTLTGKSFAPPHRLLNARDSQSDQGSARIVIRCILYSDGSASWRARGSDADCQLLRNRGKED